MYSAPGSKTTIISTSQAIYNILETDQKYNPDISQHSLNNSETVVKLTKYFQQNSTHKNLKNLHVYSDEVEVLDSLMKCHQFVPEYIFL